MMAFFSFECSQTILVDKSSIFNKAIKDCCFRDEYSFLRAPAIRFLFHTIVLLDNMPSFSGGDHGKKIGPFLFCCTYSFDPACTIWVKTGGCGQAIS